MKLSVIIAFVSSIATGILGTLLYIESKDKEQIYNDLVDKGIMHLDFRGEIINIARETKDADTAKMLNNALDNDLFYIRRKTTRR